MSMAYRNQQEILSYILLASKQNFSPQPSIAIVVHIYNPTSTYKKCKICIELTLLVGNSHRVGYIYSSEVLLKIFCRSTFVSIQLPTAQIDINVLGTTNLITKDCFFTLHIYVEAAILRSRSFVYSEIVRSYIEQLLTILCLEDHNWPRS